MEYYAAERKKEPPTLSNSMDGTGEYYIHFLKDTKQCFNICFQPSYIY